MSLENLKKIDAQILKLQHAIANITRDLAHENQRTPLIQEEMRKMTLGLYMGEQSIDVQEREIQMKAFANEQKITSLQIALEDANDALKQAEAQKLEIVKGLKAQAPKLKKNSTTVKMLAAEVDEAAKALATAINKLRETVYLDSEFVAHALENAGIKPDYLRYQKDEFHAEPQQRTAGFVRGVHYTKQPFKGETPSNAVTASQYVQMTVIEKLDSDIETIDHSVTALGLNKKAKANASN